MAAIPTISLAAWRSERAGEREAIVRAWSSAFSQHGLFYLSNHGLAPLYHRVCRQWLHFCSLQPQHKERFSASAYGKSGYNCVGKESVALSETSTMSATPDPVESLENGYDEKFEGNFPQQSNGYVNGDSFKNDCKTLYQALHTEVILPCLDIASKALNMEESLQKFWFEEGSGANQMRLARYLPRTKNVKDDEVLYGEHTDYDGLTFLWRNQTNGLQARLGGDWQEVPVLESDPDALVINLGDLMQFWTGGLWHSPVHRVLKVGDTEHTVSLLIMQYLPYILPV